MICTFFDLVDDLQDMGLTFSEMSLVKFCLVVRLDSDEFKREFNAAVVLQKGYGGASGLKKGISYWLMLTRR